MSFLGSLLGFAGGLIGNVQQSGNIQQQIGAQKEENQKNREYNLMLARLQNRWNLEQWNRENQYNAPVNVMSRLKSAGLNPDLMYSSGGMSTLKSADSPALTAGSPSNPVDMSNLANRRVLSDALNTSMMSAQIGQIRAQTKKIESETTGQDIQNSWADLLNGKSVELTNADISYRGSQRQLTLAQTDEAKANIDRINKELGLLSDKKAVLQAQAASMSADAFYKDVLSYIESNLAPARLAQIRASTQLTRSQITRMGAFLVSELAGIKLTNEQIAERNDLYRKLGLQIDANTDKVRLDVDWYGITHGVEALSSILGAVSGYVPRVK